MRSALTLAVLVLVVACSGRPQETVAGGSVTELAWQWYAPPMRALIVLTVDDEATPEAASIRAATISALRSTFEKQFRESLGYDAALRDPAAWHPAGLRVVLVRPSAVGSSRAIGPSDDPRLAVVGTDVTTDQIQAQADAATIAIDASPAPPAAPYALLDATAQTLELVTGARAPGDAREAKLVQSLGDPEVILLAIATSHDDVSSATVEIDAQETIAVGRNRLGIAIWTSLVAQRGAIGASCGQSLDSSTRLGAWADAIRDVDTFDSTCQDAASQLAQDGLFGWGSADDFCDPSFRIASRPDGSAACLLEAVLADDTACASQPGMIDPADFQGTRAPRTTTDADGILRRVCEVVELRGAESDSCRTNVACDGCGPGWCVTDVWPVPRLTNAWDGCSPFRFVRGATPRDKARVNWVCDIDL